MGVLASCYTTQCDTINYIYIVYDSNNSGGNRTFWCINFLVGTSQTGISFILKMLV